MTLFHRGYARRKQWRSGAALPDRYLVMLRFRDWKIGEVIRALSCVTGSPYTAPVFPHITLFGLFTLRPGCTPGAIRAAVEACGAGRDSIRFPVSGWVPFTGRRGGVIAYHVDSRGEIEACYDRLFRALSPAVGSRSWIDTETGQRRFHITAGYGLRHTLAEEILVRLRSETMDELVPSACPEHPGTRKGDLFRSEDTDLFACRIAIVRNGAVHAEYDLPRQAWLSRGEAYREDRYRETLGCFRRRHGYEVTSPAREKSPGTWVISDLHLGHANIIRYCRRPFPDAREMDRVLVRNWNNTVRPDDRVFFLGDLSYGPDAEPAAEYIARLNGKITLIRGNHDEDIPDALPECILGSGGTRFRLVHEPPAAVPPGEWVIHGHMHNNDLGRYPFISYADRTVNVSAEVTGYRPVPLATIARMIATGGPEPVRLLEPAPTRPARRGRRAGRP